MTRVVETLRGSLQRRVDSPYFVPACFASGILIRLLWIYFVNGEQVADFGVYLQRAITIANGGGYSANGIPTAYAPVGYPGFLGGLFYLFGSSVFLGKFVNVLFSAGILLLTYLVGKQIFKSERAARITLCILAFHPNQIAYNGLLSAEIPFAFLILLGAVFFLSAHERTGLLLLAGVSWGLAAVTKSQAIIIPPLFILLNFVNLRSFLKSTAIIGITGALIMTPWIVRNYLVMGIATVDTHGGIVLMQGNNPYATGRGSWDSNVSSLLGDLAADEDKLFDGKEVERNERARKIGMDYIVHNPGRFVMRWPKKLLATYLVDLDGIYYTLGIEQMHNPSEWLRVINVGTRIIGQLYYVTIGVLFLISVPTILRHRVPATFIGIGILLYFAIVAAVFLGDPRYHSPLMPWVIMYAGVGAELLLWPRAKDVV